MFKLFLGSDFVVGVVGALQFDVLADRIRHEFDLPCHFEATSFELARWVDADDPKLIKRFADQNRDNIAEDAWAGDIVGIPNHGTLRIGDALTEGEELHFTGIPSFAPEFLRRVRADDPMKAKHLGRAL